jgi:hypothetical protein
MSVCFVLLLSPICKKRVNIPFSTCFGGGVGVVCAWHGVVGCGCCVVWCGVVWCVVVWCGVVWCGVLCMNLCMNFHWGSLMYRNECIKVFTAAYFFFPALDVKSKIGQVDCLSLRMKSEVG